MVKYNYLSYSFLSWLIFDLMADQDVETHHYLYIPQNIKAPDYTIELLLSYDLANQEQLDSVKNAIDIIDMFHIKSYKDYRDYPLLATNEFYIWLKYVIEFDEILGSFIFKPDFRLVVECALSLVHHSIYLFPDIILEYLNSGIISSLIRKVPKIRIRDLFQVIKNALNTKTLSNQPQTGQITTAIFNTLAEQIPYIIDIQDQCLYNDQWSLALIEFYSALFDFETIAPLDDNGEIPVEFPKIIHFIILKRNGGLSASSELTEPCYLCFSKLKRPKYVLYLIQNNYIFHFIREFTLLPQQPQMYILETLYNVANSPYFDYLLNPQQVDDLTISPILYYFFSWNKSYKSRPELFDYCCKICVRLLNQKEDVLPLFMQSEFINNIPELISNVTAPIYSKNPLDLSLFLISHTESTKYAQQLDISTLFNTIYSSTFDESIKLILHFLMDTTKDLSRFSQDFANQILMIIHDDSFLAAIGDLMDSEDEELAQLALCINNLVQEDQFI